MKNILLAMNKTCVLEMRKKTLENYFLINNYLLQITTIELVGRDFIYILNSNLNVKNQRQLILTSLTYVNRLS